MSDVCIGGEHVNQKSKASSDVRNGRLVYIPCVDCVMVELVFGCGKRRGRKCACESDGSRCGRGGARDLYKCGSFLDQAKTCFGALHKVHLGEVKLEPGE